jgi:elongation factor Ts
MDCKKALAENNNDIEVAAEWLRKKGLVSAAKKGARVAAEGAIGSYIHAGARIGTVVEINCETDFVARGERFQTLLRDVAMQIAACPDVQVVDTSDVDEAWKAKEREIEMGKEDILSKPEKLRPQIVDGRIAKRVNEVALLEQAYIRDTDKKVGDLVKEYIAELGENIKIRRFSRYNLGEGIEKKVSDFAAEVAAATGAK